MMLKVSLLLKNHLNQILAKNPFIEKMEVGGLLFPLTKTFNQALQKSFLQA